MENFKIGKKIPKSAMEIVSDGLSGCFNNGLLFVYKSDDIVSEEIEIFNSSKIGLDLLEINLYKDKIGSVYSFSIFIDGLIDNSEILFDFRHDNIKSLVKENYKGEGIKVRFLLANENDEILGIREFVLSEDFSNLISLKAYLQNREDFIYSEDYFEYIKLTFENIFKNEPEENLKLYSIGSFE